MPANNEYTRQVQLDVGATSVQVCDGNLNAIEKYFYNSSAGGQEITLSFSNQSPAVANVGIVLKAGAAYAASVSEGFRPYNGIVNAIANGAGGKLTIMER